MRWLVALTLLAVAGVCSSQAEQEVSIANALPRPVGVVYLLDIISPPRQKAEAFDYESSNLITDGPSYGNKHSFLLVRPIPAEIRQVEAVKEPAPKYLVRTRRGTFGGESGGFGGGGGGGGGGGFGGGGGLGGGLGGGHGGGGHGGGGGLGGGGGKGGFGGGDFGGGGGNSRGGGGNFGGGGHGGGGAGSHASASASAQASAKSGGYGIGK